jgi:hypothetical protein
MFYDGLVESGVDVAKAKLMYYAVYLAGPKWVQLVPGKPCGPNCIFKEVFDLKLGANDLNQVIIARKGQYDDPEIPGNSKRSRSSLLNRAIRLI